MVRFDPPPKRIQTPTLQCYRTTGPAPTAERPRTDSGRPTVPILLDMGLGWLFLAVHVGFSGFGALLFIPKAEVEEP